MTSGNGSVHMDQIPGKDSDRNGNQADNGVISSRLSHPDDKRYLCELLCFVRFQIEAFVVSPDIRDPRFRRLDGKIGVGRVGLRCVHCARNSGGGVTGGVGREESPLPSLPVSRNGAVSYPKAIRLIYQSVRNWQRVHMMSCPSVPREVKERCNALKTSKGRATPKTGVPTGRYWEECCKRMGMIDTDDGIKIGIGRFIVDTEEGGAWTEGLVGVSEPSVGIPDPVPVSGRIKVVLHTTTSTDKLSLKRPSDNVKRRHSPPNGTVSQLGSEVVNIPVAPSSVNNNSESTNGATELQWNQFRASSPSSLIPRIQPSPTISALLQSSTPAISELKQATVLPEPLQQQNESASLDLEQHWARVALETNYSCSLPVNPLGSETVVTQSKAPFSTPRTTCNSPPQYPLPNSTVMERLTLARSIVQTMRKVCPRTEYDECNDLSILGSELYKIFSGKELHESKNEGHADNGLSARPFSMGTVNNFGLNEDQQSLRQRTKREKRLEEGCFTVLSEMGLPIALCCVISSLLGNGDDGYHSIAQIEEDLRLMAEMPEKFLFGSVSENLHLTDISFCGRDKEVSKLVTAFEQVTEADMSTKTMVLVTGYSGTGKSSLISHVQHRFVGKGACFVSGKFDAMQQPQPLSAIASAMNDYCDILAQDEARIDTVREAVASAIGSEGNVLADLMPNLQKIVHLGDDPPIQLQGREALQRVLFTFRMLFWATCSTTHPVVMFLDDLQWADKVSLELMEVLVTDTMLEGLLFIGSYRDNEVGVDHPLSTHIGSISRSGCVNTTSIHLGNLDIKSVNSMVSDSLHLVPGMVRPLAEAVLNKTGGNALFAVQFLASLRDEGLLTFSLSSKRWEWDIHQIREKDVADNVVELMVAKLLRLAPEVQEALSVAAGFGATCVESLLHIIDRAAENFMSTVLALDVAVSEGLMVKSDSAYRFSHDQIQCAAYLLIPEPDREKFHLRIGRWLWKSSSSEELQRFLFVVVDQLHRGSSLITNDKERIELSELSLLAGNMAIAMSAYLPAAAHLRSGISLLTENDWVGRRNLCLDLYNCCAETEYTLGDFGPIRGRLEEVLSQTTTPEEKLRPYATLVKSLLAQGLSLDAIDSCTEVLVNLGESFPRIVTPAAVQQELVAVQRLLRMKADNELRNLEYMEYAEKEEAMRFLAILGECVFQSKKEYFPLVVCRMVNLSLMHGVCKESALCFAWYGVILSGHFSDFDGAYCFAQLSLHHMDRCAREQGRNEANIYFAKIYVTVYGFIHNWVQPIQLSVPCLERAVDVGLATGDTYSAFVASNQFCGAALSSGKPLDQLLKESEVMSKRIGGYEQHALYPCSLSIRQTILNLQGYSQDPSNLMGVGDSEEGIVRAQYSFYSMWLEYLFGHYDRAAQTAKKIEDLAQIFSASMPLLVCNYTLFSCLNALVLARRYGRDEYLQTISKSIAQMEKWTGLCKWNCLHKLELLRAEYAYLEGDIAAAAHAYDAAERTAAAHSFVRDQALALERAGIFYVETGESTTAGNLFVRACECYKKWGAFAKATQVQEMYL
uniref:Orc1-like AAA ATPase domain-containing protein n=1 Tax=Odontella aurita TaxID=265563 RepID=A0A7S4NBI8_9STRA|mmetsp:Transcript_57291/g.170828  ORF Transcript_57291/g.170828 Transcript_57291/m.170828 type:complete len:1540 (+) Transcript_57291:210-4829(+)